MSSPQRTKANEKEEFFPLLTILRIIDAIDVARCISIFITYVILFVYVAAHVYTNSMIAK